MENSTRNLSEYAEHYMSLPFEPIQIQYRRKLVLSQVARYGPKRLLEVGCGVSPLCVDIAPDTDVTVVEPAVAFAENAMRLLSNRPNCKVHHDFIESVDLGGYEFDMIIVSCLLHEIPDPSYFLKTIRGLCTSDTVVHINVPNSKSFHRLLAVAMGLIPSVDQRSETQRLMQQRDVPYDVVRLHSELASEGFRVVDEGSLLVKPFTHAQMQRLVDDGFMTPTMLDGFDRLVDFLPELGSEIWVNAQRIE